jgi:hypothetical protein
VIWLPSAVLISGLWPENFKTLELWFTLGGALLFSIWWVRLILVWKEWRRCGWYGEAQRLRLLRAEALVFVFYSAGLITGGFGLDWYLSRKGLEEIVAGRELDKIWGYQIYRVYKVQGRMFIETDQDVDGTGRFVDGLVYGSAPLPTVLPDTLYILYSPIGDGWYRYHRIVRDS